MTNEFRQVIIDSGLIPPDFIQSGKFHRFAGIGKSRRNKAGWCYLFDDGNCGAYGDWSTNLSETWHKKNNLSPIERKAFNQKANAVKHKAKQKRKQAQANASIEALNKWNKATTETGDHKYLRNKNIQPHGIRTDGFNLLIPMYDENKKLCSIQSINPNGEKLFYKGGRVKGCYYPIGKPNGVICLAEGYATAATIHEATGYAVAVCFNAGNLKPVAQAIHKKHPQVKITIYADNDIHTDKNPGLKRIWISARPGATPRWDARQRINQVWARDCGLKGKDEHTTFNIEH